MSKNKIIQYIKQKNAHRLFFLLSSAFTGVLGVLLCSPTIGAMGVLITIYLFLVIYVPWEQIACKKIFLSSLTYVTPAIFCILSAWFGWDKLIAIFPSNSTENIFINHIIRKNVVSSTNPYKYELLVEFGARYSESNVDLEINTKNAHENIEAWWDKPNLTQKSSSFIDINQPVTNDYAGGTAQAVLHTHIILQDITKSPIYKLKFEGSNIIPEKRSFYLLFQGNKPLDLKSVKFMGKTF